MSKFSGARTAERRQTYVRVRPQHLRAIQIDRDYRDPSSSEHYVVTPFVEETFERLAVSLATGSTSRAWRVTGDYGAGKSSFGLAFARYARGLDRQLPAGLRHAARDLRLEPVLVSGQREPVARSLSRALLEMMDRERLKPSKSLRSQLAEGDEASSLDVLSAVQQVGDLVRAGGTAHGLLIIFDELGKNLEHAAHHAQHGDLHALQLLADGASRSGDEPYVVMAMLHQGVGAYARDLATTDRKEWEKVASRFQEVVFAPPLEQAAVLIASALDVDASQLPRAVAKAATVAMSAAVQAGWYGAGAPEAELVALAPRLAPLDGFVLPVLARVLRRFGQNERSLFSFLSSAEPHGLMDHARAAGDNLALYRLCDLYDYLANNFSSALESGAAATRWGLVDAVVRSTPVEGSAERDALKTVAILNLLDDPGLAATPETLAAALGSSTYSPSEISAALARLITGVKVLYNRGLSGGLCLWPHTSVDLEAAFQAGLAATPLGDNLLQALGEILPMDPLIARRHYVETGAMRAFPLAYTDRASLAAALQNGPSKTASDGLIVLALSRNDAEQQDAIGLIEAHQSWPDTLLVGAPAPVGGLAPLLRDVRAWRWVRDHTPGLGGDQLARQELARQLSAAEERLRRSLAALIDLHGDGALTTRWWWKGQALDIRSSRDLAARLSEICTEAFKSSPIVRNELINRRALSTAAARARSVLVEALTKAPEKPLLGMNPAFTPPEMAIYLSVLQEGGLHVERDGRWVVEAPVKDKLRFRPALAEINRVLTAVEDRRVPYEEVAAALRAAPFGVRDGLIPLIIAIYLAIHWHRTAVYEEGTYLEQVGDREFARMLKESEHFTLQHCAIDGVRAEVFSRLARVVDVTAPASEPDLLDVVRPLLQFVARLPDHARRTRALTVQTAAVRSVLLRVQDPTALVFTDLPKACGLEPFSATGPLHESQLEAFITAMASAVLELRSAYPALLSRLTTALSSALEASGPLEALQAVLSHRAARLGDNVVEPELKAFILRLSDTGLAAKAWLESIASFLARKPPERWAESDEREFHHRLKLLGRRFARVQATLSEAGEPLAVAKGESAYRMVITGADGQEINEIVRGGTLTPEVRALEAQFSSLLAQHGKAGLLAAAIALVGAAEQGHDGES
jgi:hypothetical protein